MEELPTEKIRLQAYRDKLERDLLSAIPGLIINAQNAPRIPNTTNITVKDIEADALLLRLPNLMMSTGSACNTGAPEPSPVLCVIGLSRAQAASSIRISLGRMTRQEDVEEVIRQFKSVLEE